MYFHIACIPFLFKGYYSTDYLEYKIKNTAFIKGIEGYAMTMK